jgi:hypothetical protein
MMLLLLLLLARADETVGWNPQLYGLHWATILYVLPDWAAEPDALVVMSDWLLDSMA